MARSPVSPTLRGRRQRGPLDPIFDVPITHGTVPANQLRPRPKTSMTGHPLIGEHRITKARVSDDVVEYALVEDGHLLTNGLAGDTEEDRREAMLYLFRHIVSGRPPVGEHDS